MKWLVAVVCALVLAPPASADHLFCTNIFSVWCYGTSGSDLIISSDRSQSIDAKGGHDTIKGNAGNDRLRGSTGRDTISGGKGWDRIYGGPGADSIQGGKGRDNIFAGCVTVCSQSGENADRLFGDDGDDVLRSANGKRDIVVGGSGFDTCIVDFDDLSTIFSCENVSSR